MGFFQRIIFIAFMGTLGPALAQEPPPAPSLTALQIMEKQEAMNQGYHGEDSTGRLIIVSPSGSELVRGFRYRRLEAANGEGEKALIKILSPADLKGTGLLLHEHSQGEDDQWLYLPALKKSKRIAGSAKSGRFIGSEFSYEDLQTRRIQDYDYQLLREEACGTASCYVIEAKSKLPDSIYSKTTLWVSKDNFQNQNMDLYNKKGILEKKAFFEDYRLLNEKFWRPHKIVMKNVADNRESRFIVENLKIGLKLSTSDFTKTVLER